MDHPERRSFLSMAGFVEGGLILLAFALAIPADLDPLRWLHWTWAGFGWGLVATIPMVAMLLLFDRVSWKPITEIKDFLVVELGPLLQKCAIGDLIYLAILAGVAEEIFFRGLLQPWFGRGGNWMLGLLLSNVVFALAHFVSRTYAVLAGLIGLYLGWLLIAPTQQNLLVPITAHAAYDFVAFLLVRREYVRR